MGAARAFLLTLIVATLPAALAAPADSGRLVPGPAWEYQFPPGLVDSLNFAITPDYRYLAMVSGRWTYHPQGKPEQATSEGENAIYVFDLKQKRLLWKQVLPEGTVPLIRGISPGAEFTAVEVAVGRQERVRYRTTEDEELEGVQFLGPREPGLRLYGRDGTLAATRAPLEGLGRRQHCGLLVLRPPKRGEEPVSEELRQVLAGAGIEEVAVVPPRELITTRSRDGAACIVGLNEDGAARWEWAVPAHEPFEDSRVWPIILSPDGECAVARYPIATPGARGRTMRFHFFSRADGWHWSRDFPRGMPWTISCEVSNGGRSVLIERDQGDRTTVDVLGPDGQTKNQYTFHGIAPVRRALGPSGRYWAGVLARYVEGPGVDDLGWTQGLHVFDCASGEVVWRSPMEGAREVLALDSGGAVAIYGENPTLAVFDPPN